MAEYYGENLSLGNYVDLGNGFYAPAGTNIGSFTPAPTQTTTPNPYSSYGLSNSSSSASNYQAYNPYAQYLTSPQNANAEFEAAAARRKAEITARQATSKKNAGEGIDNSIQQSYIAREQQKTQLPQMLSASGLSGGVSETTNLGVLTAYQDAINNYEKQRQKLYSDIDMSASGELATLDEQLAQQLSSERARQEQMAYQYAILMWQQQQFDREMQWQREQAQMAQAAKSRDYESYGSPGSSSSSGYTVNSRTPASTATESKGTSTAPKASTSTAKATTPTGSSWVSAPVTQNGSSGNLSNKEIAQRVSIGNLLPYKNANGTYSYYANPNDTRLF